MPLTASRAFGFLVGAVGMAAGVKQLFDNSFLTHLATGRLILDSGFPTEDPYTFTAAGLSWVPQSWLASLLYAGAEELGGLELVRLVNGLTTAALAVLGWQLVRSAGSVFRRFVAVGPFLLMGAFGWAHRPYLFGLLCLAAVLLAAEDRLDPRWLLPVGWVWLNVHGSWPLGFAALATLWAGRRLDHESTEPERRSMAFLAGGVALGVLNPYGPRLLAFPLTAVTRREAFREIREWQPPDFASIGQLAFLGVVALAIVALARHRSWRAAVPLVVFLCAALLSARNLHVASLVLLPATARGLAGDGPGFAPSRLVVRAVAALGIALGLVAALVALGPDPFGDEPYPVAAERFLDDRGIGPTDARVIAHDYVGNWIEAVYGPRGQAFIDDRVEVIPLSVIRDYDTLQDGGPGWEEALARYEPAAVLWERDRALAELLRASPCWSIEHEDEKFVVALPVDADGCD